MTRLDQYGLRTLGQIARLEELTLRRQFGVAAGTFLAAIASGDDPRPFSPTSLPPRQGFRLRFAIPASPERLLAALPYLSQSATELLRKRRLLARRLRIRLQWVEGDTRQTSETLRQPIVDMHLLSQELRRLALLLLINHSVCQSPEDREDQGAGEIEELQLFLEDEIVARSEQQILWSDQTQLAKFTDQQQRERKLAILQTISNTLARRHGHLHYSQPLLFRQCLSRPEAIFPEERFSREDFTSLSRWKDPPFSLRMTRSVAEHIGRKADTL